MIKTVLVVDPPEGWKYGFPAPLEECYQTQLKKHSYPKELMDFAITRSRYWEIKVDD